MAISLKKNVFAKQFFTVFFENILTIRTNTDNLLGHKSKSIEESAFLKTM